MNDRANSGANPFNILFGILSGPPALATRRKDEDQYTSPSETRNSCRTVEVGTLETGGMIRGACQKLLILFSRDLMSLLRN